MTSPASSSSSRATPQRTTANFNSNASSPVGRTPKSPPDLGLRSKPADNTPTKSKRLLTSAACHQLENRLAALEQKHEDGSLVSSPTAARKIVTVIKQHRKAITDETLKGLTNLSKEMASDIDASHAEIAAHDQWFGDLLNIVRNLPGEATAHDLRGLRKHLRSLEPSKQTDAEPVLVRRNSVDELAREQKKAHRRAKGRSMPTGIAPLPLDLLQSPSKRPANDSAKSANDLPGKQVESRDEIGSPTLTADGGSRSGDTRSATPLAAPVGSIVNSERSEMPQLSSPRRVPQQLKPVAPRRRAGSAVLVLNDVRNSSAPGSADGMPAKRLPASTGTASGKVKQRSAIQKESADSAAAKASSRSANMSQGAMKAALRPLLENGQNKDDFVEHYGPDSWDALVDVWNAMDENDDSQVSNWRALLKKAGLVAKVRQAVINTALLPRPEHTHLPAAIIDFLELVRGVLSNSTRQASGRQPAEPSNS